MNALAWADRNLKTMGDFDAFVSDGRMWRSSGVADHAARLASGLVALGIKPGERVLLWLPNSADLVIAWRATLRAGCVAVVAHRGSPGERIRQLAAEIEPAALVTLAALAQDLPARVVRHRIHAGAEQMPGWIGMPDLVAAHRPLRDPVPRAATDPAFIQFTSGSTGTPKGVVTRHGSFGAMLTRSRLSFGRWRRPIRNLSVLPMSSTFGSQPLFEGLGRKCTHFIVDRFEPEEVLHAVQTRRIERMHLVPAMAEAILAVPGLKRFDLSSLHTVVCGGAIVTPALIERFQAACGVHMVVNYGMTGVGGVSRASPSSKAGSVGRPFPRLQAKVVDPQGRNLPAGEIGELVLYLNKDATVEYWNRAGPASPAAEGWYHTGDLARFDADGELFVVGRADDLIIQGGHNVYAETVADVIRRLPEVKECAVAGVPSDFLGQEVVACVALQEKGALGAGDIIAHCRKHLEALAVPASVWFVPAVPRNEAGKVKIFELREAIQSARNTTRSTGFVQQLAGAPPAERHVLLRREVERIVAGIVGQSATRGKPGAESFQDMGLDSLGAVELTHALSESIGRPVPATLAYSHPSLDAACRHLLALMGLADRGDTPAARLSSVPVAGDRPRLEAYFSPEELAAVAARKAPAAPQQSAAAVFLTGANGFLGRFMTLEILDRLPPEGRLYALVRAPSSSAARARLHEAYGHDTSLQNLLEQQFQTGRLILLAGDMTLPRLGLALETYDRLCQDVDCIIHNAAIVDHVLGYRALFAPNVMGTVEIIRLALASRAKMINYVSTIAARPQRDEGEGQIAAGYSATKWASEILLKELSERFGIPVRIYRPSYVVAHTQMPGQINPQDTLTRLLHGIVTTSLAPRSFYAQGHSTRNSSYDGCPVDFVARSVVTLSMAEVSRPGYVAYNIVNSHGDGNLDAIADWVASAGYPVQKMDDYGAWYRAFKGRLNGLSRSQRQRSLLPLLHGWERPRAARGPDHDTQVFRRDMARISPAVAAQALEPPHISEQFIHKCLKDMQILGMIGAPR